MQSSTQTTFRHQHTLATAPKFYVTASQPIRPAALLLAVLIAAGSLSLVGWGLGHTKLRRMVQEASARLPNSKAESMSDEDDKDDPSQVDMIVLGDPADAPTPARRSGHTSAVHPTILVHLPRFGNQFGLIPDSPAGHLLYRWLGAFNQADRDALESVLPSSLPLFAVPEQLKLRQQTGGFNLVSARELQPGLMVFRLRDQNVPPVEALGTLYVRPGSSPATIASFSLRGIADAP